MYLPTSGAMFCFQADASAVRMRIKEIRQSAKREEEGDSG